MRQIDKKMYYSLNDFLIFNDSQFIAYMNRKRAEKFLPPKVNEKLNDNIAMKWISKSGIEYEVKRVVQLIRNESKKYDTYSDEKFKELEDASATYYMDAEIKIIMKDPRTITKLIKVLIKEKMLDKMDFKSFAGESLGKNDFIKDFKETKSAIDKKYKYIIQATLVQGTFYGIADILKHNGDHYEVYDIKRSNRAKSKFVMQICAYSEILESLQGVMPKRGAILLGNNLEEELILDNYFAYYKRMKNRFDDFHNEFEGLSIIPERDDLNSLWGEEAQELLKDNIDSITNISQDEMQILKEQDILTKKDLLEKEIKDLPSSVIERLKSQASITGDAPILLEQYKGEPGNLLRLDSPQNYDIYLDVKHTETLDKQGFVYLYNLLFRDDSGAFKHKYFTCTSQKMEESTFVEFIMFVKEVFENVEEGKIFHFAPNVYDLLLEVSSKYDKDLSLIQKMFKTDRIICLQTYFKQSIVLNVTEYSIENISEALHMNLKSLGLGFESPLISLSNFKTGLDAKIQEETQRVLKDLLQDKVKFFIQLHAYMVNLRNKNGHFFEPKEERSDYLSNKENIIKKIEKRKLNDEALREKIKKAKKDKQTINYMLEDIEEELESSPNKKLEKEHAKLTKELNSAISLLSDEDMKIALKEKVEQLDARYKSKTYFDLDDQDRIVVLLSQLRKFLRKEFDVETMEKKNLDNSTKMQLNNNLGTLTDLKKEKHRIEVERKKEVGYITYSFNSNELTELKAGSEFCLIKYNHIKGKILSIDGNEIELRFTQAAMDKGIKDFDRISIRKDMQINTKGLQAVMDNNIISLEKDTENLSINKAIFDFLKRNKPDVGVEGDLYSDDDNLIERLTEVILKMNNTTLVIQGPPGAGKSYSSSQVIETLLQQGYKIGVSSNSNGAIDNLLLYIKENSSYPVFKHSAKLSDELVENDIMGARDKNYKQEYESLMSSDQGVVVGATAFSMKNIEVDYLFVDEAGQVSLLNLISMANHAKNIVLIGDQQQLEQPIKATHPGESGMSCLDYYLEEDVIPKDKGFFLPVSYRMNKDLCAVVSKYFYENKLKSSEEMFNKLKVKLNLKNYKNTGVQYISVDHKHNSKYSIEEVLRISKLVEELINDELEIEGVTRKITKDDIIIVSPYNAQVNKLKQELPDCQVGTVDMFQGREAPIAIYSLAASDISYKGIEFLLNPNRVNVALSRGQALSFVVGSEALLYQEVESLEELQLLNMYVEIMNL